MEGSGKGREPMDSIGCSMDKGVYNFLRRKGVR